MGFLLFAGDNQHFLAKVSPTTSSWLAPSEEKISRGQHRLRAWRLMSMAATYGLFVGITMATSAVSRIGVSEKFSRKFELDIVVAGCDVSIVRGGANRLRVKRWLWDWPRLERSYATGLLVRSLVLRNLVGCHNAPRFEYRKICLVKIVVNSPPTRLRLSEAPGSQADRMRIKIRDVDLAALTIDGNFDVEVRNSVMNGDLNVRSTTGTVRISKSLYGQDDNKAHIQSLRGSIYLEEENRKNLDVLYRATMRKACFSGDSDVVFFHSQPSCDVDAAWRHFDADASGFVDQTEFAKGLVKLDKCVGDGCPHYTLPLSLTSTVFDAGQNDGSSVVQLVNQDFTNRLSILNLTELFPDCYSRIKASSSSASSTNASMTVDVRAGEFRLDYVPESLPRTYWHPAKALPGIRMLQRDAETLAAKIGHYARPGGFVNRFVFAVIDVEESTGGIPADRWLYASNDVYLELNPALLEMLSFTFLAPRVARYRVRFTNGDACENSRNQSLTEKRAKVYEEIRAALTLSSALETDRLLLRGELVRVKRGNSFAPYSTNLEAYRFLDGSFEAFDYEATAPGHGATAFYTSFILALVAALFLLLRFMQAMTAVRHNLRTLDIMQKRLKKRHPPKKKDNADDDGEETYAAAPQKRRRRRRKTLFLDWVRHRLLRRPGEPDEKSDDEEREWRARSLPLKYRFLVELAEPFVRPIEVIDAVLLLPLKRWLVEPMAAFVHMRCVLDSEAARFALVTARRREAEEKGGTTSVMTFETAENVHAVAFDVFMQAHRAFCFQRKLRPVSGRENLQRSLVKTFNLRLKRRDFPYVVGLRWKVQPPSTKNESLLIDTDRYCTEATAFFNDDDDGYCGNDGNNCSSKDDVKLETLLSQFLLETTEPVDPLPMAPQRTRIAICDSAVFAFDGVFGKRKGLKNAFDDWRQESTDISAFRSALRAVCRSKEKICVKRITKLVVEGARLKNFEAGDTTEDLPPNFFLFTFLAVWLHTFLLVIWPLGLCVYAFQLQIKYSKFAGNVISEDATEHWLTAYDYGKPRAWTQLGQKTSFVFIAEYLIYSFCASVLAAVLRQYVHYANDDDEYHQESSSEQVFPTKKKRFPALMEVLRSCARMVCALASLLTFLNVLTFFLVSCLWILAAAAIDPTEYLRYTAAAATIVTVTASLYRELLLAAVLFRATFEANFHRRILKVLRNVFSLQQRDQQEDIVLSSSEDDVDELFLNAEEGHSPAKKMTDAQLAFKALDVKGANAIAFEEVAVFVDSLQIGGLDSAKVDQIFAHADRNLDEKLNIEEFEAAWDWLKQEIVGAALNKAGLGASAIVFSVAVAVLLMLGTFAFIFQVVAAFTESRTFAAIVEAGLVAMSGISMKRAWSLQANKNRTEPPLSVFSDDNNTKKSA